MKGYRHRRTGRRFSELRVVAHHEGGHAVMANLLGLPIEGVVAQDEDGDGWAWHTDDMRWLDDRVALFATARAVGVKVPIPALRLDKKKREQVRAFVVVCCAGYAAESLLLGGAASHRWNDRRTTDRIDAEIGAKLLGERDVDRYVQRARAEARRLLLLHWEAVRELARQLMKREDVRRWRVVDGKEVGRIVRRKR
jgi:hypothetical protein